MGYSRRDASPRTAALQTCAICERTLLLGERTMRFAPEGEDFLDVCPLCQEIAAEQGWLKEGSPTTPTFEEEPRSGTLQPRGVPRSAPRDSRGIARARADPAPALRPRARDGRGRRPLQRERLPPNRRRHRQEPRQARRERRPALGREQPRSWSPSRGTSPGTSTASCPSRRSRSASPSAGTSSRSSSRRSGPGTRASTRTDESSRKSRGSRTDLQLDA